MCPLAHLHQHTQTLSLSLLISSKIPSCNHIKKTKVIPLSGFGLNTGPGCWNQDSGRPKHERHQCSYHHHSIEKYHLEISFFSHQCHHLMKAHPREDLWSALLPSDNHHWSQNHGDLLFCAHILLTFKPSIISSALVSGTSGEMATNRLSYPLSLWRE